MVELKEFQKKLENFRDARDWKQFHKAKDLTIAMNNEVAEILEHFRFKSDEEIEKYLLNEQNKKEVSYEIADVFMYLLSLCNAYNISLEEATLKKFQINEKKYTIKKYKSKKEKYSKP